MEYTPKDKMLIRAIVALASLFFIAKAISIGLEIQGLSDEQPDSAVHGQVVIEVDNGDFWADDEPVEVDGNGSSEAVKARHSMVYVAIIAIVLIAMGLVHLAVKGLTMKRD